MVGYVRFFTVTLRFVFVSQSGSDWLLLQSPAKHSFNITVLPHLRSASWSCRTMFLVHNPNALWFALVVLFRLVFVSKSNRALFVLFSHDVFLFVRCHAAFFVIASQFYRAIFLLHSPAALHLCNTILSKHCFKFTALSRLFCCSISMPFFLVHIILFVCLYLLIPFLWIASYMFLDLWISIGICVTLYMIISSMCFERSHQPIRG